MNRGQMSLITPSKLSLFSRSPVIGAWWEELDARCLFDGEKPEITALDQQLFDDGIRHERVLLDKLEAQGYRVARLPGKQNQADHAATKAAMAEGFDFIHQASLCNEEMRGSADLLRRIEEPSGLGPWSYIPIECKLASKPRTTFLVQARASACWRASRWGARVSTAVSQMSLEALIQECGRMSSHRSNSWDFSWDNSAENPSAKRVLTATSRLLTDWS